MKNKDEKICWNEKKMVLNTRVDTDKEGREKKIKKAERTSSLENR
jgi:hypothetical protein